MANDDDEEIQKLEEQQKRNAERLETLKATKAKEQQNDTSLIRLGQDVTMRSEVDALGTQDGLRVELPTRQFDTDTRNSIFHTAPGGKDVPTHKELTGKEKEAVLKKVGIDDGVDRKVYARTSKVPSTELSGGKTIETVVEATEYIISKDPSGVRGLVLPKAVMTETKTTDKGGTPIGSSTVTMVAGEPIKVHVEYANGKIVDQQLTVGKESLDIETTTAKQVTGKTYNRGQLMEKGGRAQKAAKPVETQPAPKDAGALSIDGLMKSMEEALGVKVTLTTDSAQLNGQDVPAMTFKVGSEQAADALASKLAGIRNAAGMSKSDLALDNDKNGNVIISFRGFVAAESQKEGGAKELLERFKKDVAPKMREAITVAKGIGMLKEAGRSFDSPSPTDPAVAAGSASPNPVGMGKARGGEVQV